VTFRRSNAFPAVAGMHRSARTRRVHQVLNFAKYRVTGPGSMTGCSVFTNRLPPVSGSTSPPGSGRNIVGEFSVARVGADDFSCSARRPPKHHSRWFRGHLTDGAVRRAGLVLVGLSLAGPQAATCCSRSPTLPSPPRITRSDVPPDRHRDDPRLRRPDDLHRGSWLRIGSHRSISEHCSICFGSREAMRHRPVRFRALMSLRMEKMFGTWARIPSGLHAGRARAPIAQARS
jgi:dimethylglycine dehydrogenase